jgi:hypothetical protein
VAGLKKALGHAHRGGFGRHSLRRQIG